MAASSKVASVLNLTDTQVSELIRRLNLPEFPGLADVYTMVVDSAAWESIDAMRDAVRFRKFTKFDPSKIMAAFMGRAKNHPVTAKEKTTIYNSPNGESLTVYSGCCDPKTDLLFLITLFLERGNNIKKMRLKCDESMSQLITRKASLYGIVTDPAKNKTILGSSQLTLARISQAFAPVTAFLILDRGIKGKLKPKLLHGVTTLPLLMQHTIFSCLIPQQNSLVTNDLRNIALILNIETNILLASPYKKRKLEASVIDDMIESAQQYVDAAINSTISDGLKIKVLTKGQIIGTDGKLSNVVKRIAALAEHVMTLGKLRYNDAVVRMREDSEDADAKGGLSQGGSSGHQMGPQKSNHPKKSDENWAAWERKAETDLITSMVEFETLSEQKRRDLVRKRAVILVNEHLAKEEAMGKAKEPEGQDEGEDYEDQGN